jgi:hypothetical protein
VRVGNIRGGLGCLLFIFGKATVGDGLTCDSQVDKKCSRVDSPYFLLSPVSPEIYKVLHGICFF